MYQKILFRLNDFYFDGALSCVILLGIENFAFTIKSGRKKCNGYGR
jgi:hypothetical protein